MLFAASQAAQISPLAALAGRRKMVFEVALPSAATGRVPSRPALRWAIVFRVFRRRAPRYGATRRRFLVWPAIPGWVGEGLLGDNLEVEANYSVPGLVLALVVDYAG